MTGTAPIQPRTAAQRASARASPADALFRGTQQRVLALLFGQPARSFYANELIALTRAGSGAVQRELARLAQTSLVTVRLSGNQKHYQANPASPIFEELTGIVRKTVAVTEPLRAALMPVVDRIHAAFIYGSVAKRREIESSDVDLMIVSDDLTYADLHGALEAASEQLGRRVKPTISTRSEVSNRNAGGSAIVKRVLDQPKIWLKGDENALGH